MSLKQNIIYVYFKGKHLTTSKSQYQYNRKQYLYFADINLPQVFEVHFSDKEKGEAKPQIGSNRLVEIPDEYFWNGATQIFAWVYLHSDVDDGETVYEVRIPLIKRGKPIDEEPLPVQQSAIDRAIAELNNAIDITTENANSTNADRTQVANIKDEVVELKSDIDDTATIISQKAQDAINASQRSEASAQNSADYEADALDYMQQAKASAQEALGYKNIAVQKSEIATDASAEALGYRDEVLQAKTQVIQEKQNVVGFRDETKGYRDEALTIKNNITTLKEQIDDISDAVDTNAQIAHDSMVSANSASQNASQSASSASQSAIQAEQYKNQSATNVTHYPKVVNGYWYIWDANENDFVSTGQKAQGEQGITGDTGLYFYTTLDILPIPVDKDGNIKKSETVGLGLKVYQNDVQIPFECTTSTATIDNITVTVRKTSEKYGLCNITLPASGVPFTGDTRFIALNFVVNQVTYTRFVWLVKIQDGQTGQDGNGIVSTVLNNDYTLTITFDDGTSYTTSSIRGQQGLKGDTGKGIQSTVLNNDYTLTITFTDGTTYTTPSIKGNTGDTGDSGVYIGTEEPSDENVNVWIDSDGTSDGISDVQIDETSIVENGVANIPKADSSNLGVVKVNTSYGIGSLSDGTIGIVASSLSNIKQGTTYASAITPARQDTAVFYGLAKASGDETQKVSDNEVGNYTDEAKASIQEMLGVPSEDDVVTDVQINGTSIVNNGVANIPIADRYNYGTVKYYSGVNGLRDSNGFLVVDSASSSDTKTGTNAYKPITPLHQHEGTFYGLAKASGDTTQSQSENSVGQYTDEAKTSIQNMLDVPSKEDNLKSYATNTSSGSIASFTDGADNVPVKSLVIDINPVQDLHGYDSPWVGGGHYNILDEEFEEGRFDTTTGANVATSTQLRTKNINKCLPDTQYYFSSYYAAWFIFYDGNGNVIPTPTMPEATATSGNSVSIPKGTFTTPTGAYGFRIYLNTSYGTTYNHDIAINYPSSVTTYSPYENICPISGWTGMNVVRTGKNLVDINSPTASSTNISASNGIITSNQPSGSGANRYISYTIANLKVGLMYRLSVHILTNTTGDRIKIALQDGGTGSAQTGYGGTGYIGFTFEATDTSVTFRITQASNGSWTADELQLEFGELRTAYEPYRGQLIPISWQTEAGTVYGGSLDVLSGVLTVDMVYGQVTAEWLSNRESGYIGYISSVTALGGSPAVWVRNAFSSTARSRKSGGIKALCNAFKISMNNSNVSSSQNRTAFAVDGVTINNVSSFISAVQTLEANGGGLFIAYELATPITYQLTPHEVASLLGQNNIWADTGDTTCEYRADTEMYVESQIPDVPVQDVQINGTSILSGGVANVPVASTSNMGAVKLGLAKNTGLAIDNSGVIYTDPANLTILKNGTQQNVVNAQNSYMASFYGLAKAAGDTTQSQSSNAVGNYTESAKDSIQTMLGVSPLIASHESDPFESAHAIGELFIINGKLYRAKTALTAGQYVNEGTNVEVVNVAEVLDDTYVKNDDFATASTGGLVKVDADWGIGIYDPNWSAAYGHILYISPASPYQIKTGSSLYKAIVPNHQHESVFYGLAKASGDLTQASSANEVGVYTEQAKVAIQKMLGIYQPQWELIREDTFTNATEADHTITVDSNGDPFELTDIIMMFETPVQNTYAEKGGWGQIWFFYDEDNWEYFASESGGWTQEANASSHGAMTIIEQEGGILSMRYTEEIQNTNSGKVYYRYGTGFQGASQSIFMPDSELTFTKVIIPWVTGTGHYKLYGKRKVT